MIPPPPARAPKCHHRLLLSSPGPGSSRELNPPRGQGCQRGTGRGCRALTCSPHPLPATFTFCSPNPVRGFPTPPPPPPPSKARLGGIFVLSPPMGAAPVGTGVFWGVPPLAPRHRGAAGCSAATAPARGVPAQSHTAVPRKPMGSWHRDAPAPKAELFPRCRGQGASAAVWWLCRAAQGRWQEPLPARSICKEGKKSKCGCTRTRQRDGAIFLPIRPTPEISPNSPTDMTKQPLESGRT